MVHVDMTQPDRVLKPGVDLWEIMKAESEKSTKGDAMIALKLFRVSDPSDHLFDSIMLAGGGWSIGKAKLSALIPPDHKGDLDLLLLVGRRLWVSTEVQNYKGKDGLRVQIAGLRCKGFQPAGEVPPGCALPVTPPDDPTPF